MDLVRGFRSGSHVIGYLGDIHLGYTLLARNKILAYGTGLGIFFRDFQQLAFSSMNLAFGVADKDRSLARATGRLNL